MAYLLYMTEASSLLKPRHLGTMIEHPYSQITKLPGGPPPDTKVERKVFRFLFPAFSIPLNYIVCLIVDIALSIYSIYPIARNCKAVTSAATYDRVIVICHCLTSKLPYLAKSSINFTETAAAARSLFACISPCRAIYVTIGADS